MRQGILFAALALSVFTGGFACASPPVEKTHESAQVTKAGKVFAYDVCVASVRYVACDAEAYYLTGAISPEQHPAASTANVVSKETASQNCSKPQCTGLAIRQRMRYGLNSIHVLVVATVGHRLFNLHVDPGLS